MAASHRAPTRADHEQFCRLEGWAPRTTATGKTGTHHSNFELALPGGEILITRISHPIGRDTSGPSIFAHILRDQLQVSADEFFACVDHGVLPERGSVPAPPVEAIPAGVVHTLIGAAGLPEAQVRAMTRAEAIARLSEYYTTGR